MKKTLEIVIAATRAAYGDYRSLAFLASRKLLTILKITVPIFLIILMIPVIFIYSLFTGNKTDYNSDFSLSAVESIDRYKTEWINVLALAQTKKVVSDYDTPYLSEAYEVIKNDAISTYLHNSNELDTSVIDLYHRNSKLLHSLYSNYADYVLFYDEIPYPGYDSGYYIKYDETLQHNVLIMKFNQNGTIVDRLAYSDNDVVSFKICRDEEVLKIKYRNYMLSAYFPIPESYSYTYSNDFGVSRIHDGKPSTHEGIDIFANRNTPILCIEDSTIEKIGWNPFGGWRILLKSKDGLRRYYYAHMERYIDGLSKYMDISGKVYERPNISFKAGDVIGYVGSSGSFNSSSRPDADTGTPPHIHLQIWVIDKGWFSEEETLMNPYYSLRLLEHNLFSEKRRRELFKIESEGL